MPQHATCYDAFVRPIPVLACIISSFREYRDLEEIYLDIDSSGSLELLSIMLFFTSPLR